MPADTISREEIERFLAFRGDYLEVRREHVHELAQHALTEQSRIDEAVAKGRREGIEMAARWHDSESARLTEDGRYWGDAGCVEQANHHKVFAKAIRRLSPPPAEPTGMTADGWIEWKGGECPVEPDAVVEVRMRDGRTATFDDGAVDEFWWGNDGCSVDILAYRIVKPAEPSAPVAEPARWLIYSREHNAFWRADRAGYTGVLATAGRYTRADAEANCRMRDPQRDGSPSEILLAAPEAIAALEAENAKLREVLEFYADEFNHCDGPGGSESLVREDFGARARALLQGGPDAG